MFDKSLLRRSRQFWKLNLGFTVVGTGIAVALWGVHQGRSGFPLSLAGLGLFIIGFAWLNIFPVCPRCKTRLVWKAMLKGGPHNWLSGLLSLRTCPYCGYEP